MAIAFRHNSMKFTKRTDIQSLRGIAVLLVLVYHCREWLIPNGYLGVDIFFVISGFLITQNINKDLELGTFSFSNFYIRRIRRLFPALYSTLALTLVVSVIFLTPSQFEFFFWQLLGALSYITNFVLLNQSGYFDSEATTKPLLHLWSLSVEEQFYLLLPLALSIFINRFRAIFFLFTISLIAYIFTIKSNPEQAFYLLHTRAWELLTGGMLATAPRTEKFAITHPSISKFASYASLGVIFLVAVTDYLGSQTGLFLTVVSTAVLLGTRMKLLEGGGRCKNS